jgi:transposase-like protein
LEVTAVAKTTTSKATKPNTTKNGSAKKNGKNGNGKKRPWTDADKERAIAVYVTTGNLSRTSRETGVPISTLRDWLKEQPAEKVKEAREEAQAEFVRKAWEGVTAHVEHLAERSAIAATTARDSATIVGILIDKIQLVTGQPTSNVKQQVDGQVTNRHEYDITQRIVSDPESRDIARDLFRRAISADLGS